MATCIVSRRREKLFVQQENGIRKLTWSTSCSDFVKFLQDSGFQEQDIPKERTVEKFIRENYNIALKTPRLDRCSICWAIELEIKEAKSDAEKKKFQKLLESHREDAFQVRDYVYMAFQKSYKELGKKSMNLEHLEEYVD